MKTSVAAILGSLFISSLAVATPPDPTLPVPILYCTEPSAPNTVGSRFVIFGQRPSDGQIFVAIGDFEVYQFVPNQNSVCPHTSLYVDEVPVLDAKGQITGYTGYSGLIYQLMFQGTWSGNLRPATLTAAAVNATNLPMSCQIQNIQPYACRPQ